MQLLVPSLKTTFYAFPCVAQQQWTPLIPGYMLPPVCLEFVIDGWPMLTQSNANITKVDVIKAKYTDCFIMKIKYQFTDCLIRLNYKKI